MSVFDTIKNLLNGPEDPRQTQFITGQKLQQAVGGECFILPRHKIKNVLEAYERDITKQVRVVDTGHPSHVLVIPLNSGKLPIPTL